LLGLCSLALLELHVDSIQNATVAIPVTVAGTIVTGTVAVTAAVTVAAVSIAALT
jgi:hypothetical protein